MSAWARVGVRELRQNLSVYLRRTLAGETLEVTDRGTPVALLTPVPERADPIGRLAADGYVTPAKGLRGDLGPPLDVELDRSLSDVLDELRGDAV
jgi:prevent-host-death family protein